MDSQKVCGCGCGLPTSISKWSDKRRGLVKGQPNRFLKGHRNRLVQPTLMGILAHTKESGSGCLEWLGSTSKDGYGQLWASGHQWRLHRWVYTLVHGEIPEGHVIRHKCDNPACVNPTHLLCGTHAENTNDMVERGRACTALTEAQVLTIRASKDTRKSLAGRYGVSAVTIGNARLGRTWKHLQKAGA